jgi:predicted permease
MNVLLFSFNAIAPMLFTTALGWLIARRKDIADRDIESLNRICFRYLLAFHVFNSTLAVDFFAEFNLQLVIFFIIGVLAVIAVSVIIFTITEKDPARRCNYIVCAYRSSNIVFALPMATNLFGAAGIKPAAMLIPVTIILFNFATVVIMVYYSRFTQSGSRTTLDLPSVLKKTALDVVRNPLIIGSSLGIVLSLCRIDLPAALRSGITSVASTGTPISFLLLGAQIDFGKFKTNIKPTLFACAVRLVIVPGILVPLMVLRGFKGPELGALMVVFAAPCAVTNHVMSRIYDLDPQFTGQTVTMSTVFSMITMFIGISVLRGLELF